MNRFFLSIQLCSSCANKQKLSLNNVLTFKCGYENNRDFKSTCIEKETIKQIPTDHREFTARKISPSAFLNLLINIDGIKASKVESLN